jgi:hypothetical protein
MFLLLAIRPNLFIANMGLVEVFAGAERIAHC